jgi:hypothetical protein
MPNGKSSRLYYHRKTGNSLLRRRSSEIGAEGKITDRTHNDNNWG